MSPNATKDDEKPFATGEELTALAVESRVSLGTRERQVSLSDASSGGVGYEESVTPGTKVVALAADAEQVAQMAGNEKITQPPWREDELPDRSQQEQEAALTLVDRGARNVGHIEVEAKQSYQRGRVYPWSHSWLRRS